jgi:hypothetical protein
MAPKQPAKAHSDAPKKKPVDTKEQKKIDDTVAFIKKKLDDSGWFDTVTTGDLKQITARMKTLKPDQVNQVVGKLSDGDLHKWADEAGSPLLGTGLNGEQKFDLFKNLVPGLNGKNLTRLGKEVTNADQGMADREFIMSVMVRANPDAQAAYWDEITFGDIAGSDFDTQSRMLEADGGLQETVGLILNGAPGPKQLRELINFLECFTPEERANQLFQYEETPFTPEVLSKLAEQLAVPDEETEFKKKDKQKLFDLLTSSMSGKQIADMQSALTAHDFMHAIDKEAELHRKTGQPQITGGTDKLEKLLENYTNRKSLEREANDPSNFSWLPVFESEVQSLAKSIVPHIPEIKARVPKAPVSPNGELFFQSFLKTNQADSNNVVDKKKSEYMVHISNHPVNPALKGKVNAYCLDLAVNMVAEKSAATVYNKIRDEEGSKESADQLQLFGDITLRQQHIKKTDYFSEKYSTEENGVSEATWLVNKADKQIKEYAQKFNLPPALLAGILAAEADFDTDYDIRATKNADMVNGTAYRAHDGHDGLAYLGNDKVKADLKEAKLDNALAYLNLDTTKKYVESIRKKDLEGYHDFLQDRGPMGIHHASLIALKLAHQMWEDGKKMPETKIPASFGDFLENMSASQMASIFRGYRAGTEDTGGYKHYDQKLGVHTVPGGDEFARAVKDPRAAMGYQAYQSEPYFAYYLKLHQK